MATYTRVKTGDIKAGQLYKGQGTPTPENGILQDSYTAKIDHFDTVCNGDGTKDCILHTTEDLTAGEQTEFETTVDNHTPV